jgi:hypothetical protein
MKYFVQFPAGTSTLVASALESALDKVSIDYRDDSSIVFESSTRIGHGSQLPFVSNVYSVLASVPRSALNRSIRQLVAKIAKIELPPLKGSDAGFRVMVNVDGELVSIDRDLRQELEMELAFKTGSRVNPRGSGREFWVIGRRSLDSMIIALRLPRDATRQPEKGALSQELASLLVLASNPQSSDACLDPFAGSGALVTARLGLPYRSVTYSDIKRHKLAGSLSRKVKSDPKVILRTEDALKLPSIADGEIDVIVTDLPWGEFERVPMPYPKFAEMTAASFDRVLDLDSGRFVILSSRRNSETVAQALKAAGFRIHAAHGILVNGHPASVIVGSR